MKLTLYLHRLNMVFSNFNETCLIRNTDMIKEL